MKLPVILVVDDEEIERRMIQQVLLNELSGRYAVAAVSNGYEALDFISGRKPSIIIMDIQMPVMNGIDTLKEIRKQYGRMYSIILTAHDEFEYAVQAVRIGVDDYILKPVRSSRLIEAISHVEEKMASDPLDDNMDLRQKLDFFSPYIEDSIISSIVMDSYPQERLAQIISRFFPDPGVLYMMQIESLDIGFDMLGTVESVRNELQNRGVGTLSSAIGHQGLLLIHTHGLSEKEILASAVSIAPGASLKIEKVEEAGQCSMIYRHMNCMDSSDDNPGNVRDILNSQEKNIAIKIAVQDRTGAIAMFEDCIIGLFRDGNPDPESAAYDIRMRTAIVDHYLKLTVGDINLSGISFPERISSVKEGRRIVSSYVSSRCNDVKDKQSVKLSDLLSSVISDIEANYADGLYSLSKASENLGISSTYLSKIFREHFGRTFTGYLNDVRIDEAKRLLRDGFSAGETAMKCGFNSFNYFCTVFKKYTGISATDYQKRS